MYNGITNLFRMYEIANYNIWNVGAGIYGYYESAEPLSEKLGYTVITEQDVVYYEKQNL